MPYEFAIERVEYMADGDTELHGLLKTGAISGPEWIVIPTRSGTPFLAWTRGMQVTGPIVSPVTAEHGFPICLVLQNHPPNHDIDVPSVAIGIGEETPADLEEISTGSESAWLERLVARLKG